MYDVHIYDPIHWPTYTRYKPPPPPTHPKSSPTKPIPHHTQVYRRGQPLLSGSEYRSGEELTVRVEGRSGACIVIYMYVYIWWDGMGVYVFV